MRILSEKNGGTADRIRYGFELCTSRPPDSDEIQRLTLYFNRQRDSLKSEPDAVSAMFPNRVDGTDPVDAAAWTGLSSVLLNLDEFITRE